MLTQSRTQIRVLVVDDNELDRMVMSSYLEGLGCTVVLAEGGTAAVAAASQGFAVIFMDVVMPDLDGHQASRLIRQLPAPAGRTPIVALTGNAATADRVQCLAAGMDLWLTKPVVREDLARALARFTSWKAGGTLTPAEGELDEVVVAVLLSRCAEHEGDFLADVVLQFRSSGDAAIELALRDLRARDLAGFRFAVEQVADAATNVGATGVTGLARHILAADDDTLYARGPDWLAALSSEILRAVVALGARSASLPN